MQISNFTLKTTQAYKNKLILTYNYDLTITLKKYWFITVVKVQKSNLYVRCIGLNAKDLLSQFKDHQFDDCFNVCLQNLQKALE